MAGSGVGRTLLLRLLLLPAIVISFSFPSAPVSLPQNVQTSTQIHVREPKKLKGINVYSFFSK